MILPSDLSKYPLPVKQRKATMIDLANEQVDIRDILRDMGVWTPTGDFYSYKIWCPFHYEHVDQLDKNCRLFGSTNVYCWAQHGYMAPTRLYSMWKGIPQEKAAQILLDERGLLRKPWRETWNDLMVAKAEQQKALGSKNDIVAALHTELGRHSEYRENEFSQPVRERWKIVLAYLDQMWELPEIGLDQLNEFFEVSLTALLSSARINHASEDR